MTTKVVLVAIVSALAGVPARQAPTSPTFEVASVKRAAPETYQQRGFACAFGAGGRFIALGTLQMLIACAYGIPAARMGQEISGGPRCLDDDLFAISATFPPDHIPRQQSDGVVMLRTLLADRSSWSYIVRPRKFRCGRWWSHDGTASSAHCFIRRRGIVRRGSPPGGAGRHRRIRQTYPAAVGW